MGEFYAKKLFHFFLIAFLLIVTVAGNRPAYADGLKAGGLRGTVFSKTSTPLANVKITIQREGWENSSSIETAQCGCFDSGFLLPGDYIVTFKRSGYRMAVYRHLSIPESRFVRLNVYLEPKIQTKKGTGALKKKASEDEGHDAVVYEPPFTGLELESDPYKTVIDSAMLAKLPRGLNSLSLAPLAAGVNDELLFDGLSVNGGSSSENLYFVDGTDTTTIYSGINGFDVHIDFVDVMIVQSSGLPASRAGSTGGVIDVVTKSGGSQFQGSLQLNVTGGWLDGKPRGVLRHNPLDDTIAEYAYYPEDTWTRWQPGVTLGGYILKNKLWFYGGFIPSFQKRTRDAEFIYDPDLGRIITQNTTEYQAMIKLTASLTDRIRLSLGGFMDYRTVEGALPELDGSSNGVGEFEEEVWHYPAISLSGSIDYAGRDLYLQMTGNYWRRNRYEDYDCTGPMLVHLRSPGDLGIPDVPIYCLSCYAPAYGCRASIFRRDIESRFKIGGRLDTTLKWMGDHQIVFGGQFVRKHGDKYDAYNDYVRFYWGDNFESPVTGEVFPTTLGFVEVREPFGDIFAVHSDSWALYLQDNWSVTGRLALQVGLRLENEKMPSLSDVDGYTDPPIHFDLLDKISPRLGFVYEWGDGGRTRIFGNYSVYVDTMKWKLASEQYSGFKWISHYYDIVDPYWTLFTVADHPVDTYMGGRRFESKNWRLPDFSLTQPDIKPFQKHEWSVGLQTKLGREVMLNIQVLRNWIKNAVETVGVLYPYGQTIFIGNPGSAWIQSKYDEAQELGTMPEGVRSTDAVRRFTAVTVSLEKQFSRHWLGGLSYTWSRLYGNYSGLASAEDYTSPSGNKWNYFYYWDIPYEEDSQKPNSTRYFDDWYYNVDEQGNEALGLLPTDRTHQIKAYGAYTFNFGLTLGYNAFAMSGTSVQTAVYLNGFKRWYPYGRGDLGRTPWIWQLNTYLEYNLKLSERFTLQLSLNIDNVTNNDTAQWIYPLYNEGVIYVDDQLIVDGFDAVAEVKARGAKLDPRFKMERDFQLPIAARLGAKLLF